MFFGSCAYVIAAGSRYITRYDACDALLYLVRDRIRIMISIFVIIAFFIISYQECGVVFCERCTDGNFCASNYARRISDRELNEASIRFMDVFTGRVLSNFCFEGITCQDEDSICISVISVFQFRSNVFRDTLRGRFHARTFEVEDYWVMDITEYAYANRFYMCLHAAYFDIFRFFGGRASNAFTRCRAVTTNARQA